VHLEQVYLAGVQELGVDMLPSEQLRSTPPGTILGWAAPVNDAPFTPNGQLDAHPSCIESSSA
jgi:hypothetical protein